MANKDIIVSTEQGTILNYFGVANTYDPFTNQSKLQKIEDLNFNIPELPPFDLAEFVAVSTGLLATSLSFLNYCEFSILDKETGAKITDLKNNIGEIGNTSFYPSENQIFWFNRDGLRGTFYLNKAHAGRVLHIKSGMFSTTSITSGVLNDMFARTTGVPKYIEDINDSLNQLNKRLDKLNLSISNKQLVPFENSIRIRREFTGEIYSSALYIPPQSIAYIEIYGRYFPSIMGVSFNDNKTSFCEITSTRSNEKQRQINNVRIAAPPDTNAYLYMYKKPNTILLTDITMRVVGYRIEL